jgi:hypothetical protein
MTKAGDDSIGSVTLTTALPPAARASPLAAVSAARPSRVLDEPDADPAEPGGASDIAARRDRDWARRPVQQASGDAAREHAQDAPAVAGADDDRRRVKLHRDVKQSMRGRHPGPDVGEHLVVGRPGSRPPKRKLGPFAHRCESLGSHQRRRRAIRVGGHQGERGACEPGERLCQGERDAVVVT